MATVFKWEAILELVKELFFKLREISVSFINLSIINWISIKLARLK